MSSDLKVTNIKHASSGSNNLVLASDGSASFPNTTIGVLQNIRVLESGTTYTIPSGIRQILVYCTAGGGGGGGDGSSGDVGACGGAGGTAIKLYDVSSTSTITYAIGAGGSGGAAGDNNGNQGGISSFEGPGGTISASPGGGGQNGNANPCGGLGGIGSGGDLNLRGGDGDGGMDAASGNISMGSGGDSHWQGGGRAGHYNSGEDPRAGLYGSGGGGAMDGLSTGAGADGGDGVIVVFEYK